MKSILICKSIRQWNRRFRQRYISIIILIFVGFIILRTGETVDTKNTENFIQENNIVYDWLYAIREYVIAQIASYYFPPYTVVYINRVAYDIHSIRELSQQRISSQWLTFPLPGETNEVEAWIPTSQSNKTFPFFRSPKTKTDLAYVDDLYVVTDLAFLDRIENINRMFVRHNLPISSIQWRHGNRNRSKCDGKIHMGSHHYILNLTPGLIGDATQQRYCAVTIHHVKIWHQIAARNSTLSLVLEDDAIFVPFFKEKFNRFVYTAIRTGALKINQTQCASNRSNVSANEWINQDPAFVVGACANIRDPTFPSAKHNAPPRLSTHKEKFSRCSHAYVLTRCSAQALLRQMYAKKIPFHPVDWLQNYLGETSLTLQPFWLDPGLAYQGSQATDLENISTFTRSMTQENET